MESRRTTPAEREREAREAAARRRKKSVRLGAAGIALLFGGGVGVVLSPGSVAALLGVMGIGIALLFTAFLLVRTSLAEVLQAREP
ncbi:MAG TPA: hypothetical protein VF992_04305 [Thermoplasmata archaeon]